MQYSIHVMLATSSVSAIIQYNHKQLNVAFKCQLLEHSSTHLPSTKYLRTKLMLSHGKIAEDKYCSSLV